MCCCGLFAVKIFGLGINKILFFRVLNVTQKEKSKARPIALNTVEMLRCASSGLGKYSAKPRTMDLFQCLVKQTCASKKICIGVTVLIFFSDIQF